MLNTNSIRRLEGVDDSLVSVIKQAANTCKVKFQVAYQGGIRFAEEQNKLFMEGKSKLDGYVKKSKHQIGKAFDIVCYTEDDKPTWDTATYCYVAGHILATAATMNVDVRWGGNWDNDGTILSDQNFDDLAHFEI